MGSGAHEWWDWIRTVACAGGLPLTCCAVLSNVVLCSAVLLYAIMCHAMLCCSVLCLVGNCEWALQLPTASHVLYILWECLLYHLNAVLCCVTSVDGPLLDQLSMTNNGDRMWCAGGVEASIAVHLSRGQAARVWR